MSDIEMNQIEETNINENPESRIAIPNAESKNISHKAADDEVGWGSMIFNFLKALIFGLCVFFYDMTSKKLFKFNVTYNL